MRRKFTHADFVRNSGEDQKGSREEHDKGLQKGVITCYYSNGTFEEFPNHTRKQFFDWEGTQFDKREAPGAVTVLPPILEAEDLPQPEPEEEEEPNIHPMDFIGQATGFQSWNFQMDENGKLLPPLKYELSKPKVSEEPCEERPSTYHGVYWLDDTWIAAIKDRDKWVILGRFDSEIAAADHFDCAGVSVHWKRRKAKLPR